MIQEQIVDTFGSHLTYPNYIKNTDVWQIACYSDGTYIATNSGGLWFYRHADHKMIQIDRNIGYQQNSTDQIRAVHRDDYERLWLGSSVDVYYEELNKKEIRQSKMHSSPDLGLPSNNIFTVSALSSGEVAIGSDQGLSIYNLTNNQYRHKRFPLYNANNYNNHINHIFEYEDAIWVGSWSGLMKLDRNNFQILERYVTFSNAGTDHDTSIIKLEIGAPFQSVVDKKNDLWLLNNHKAILKISGSSDRRKIKVYDKFMAEGDDATSMAYHPDLGLFATTSNQVYKYNYSLDRFESLHHDTIKGSIKQITFSQDGKAYLLIDNAMFIIRLQDKYMNLDPISGSGSFHELDHLVIDPAGKGWLTERSGIIRWDLINGHQYLLDADKFLFSSSFNRMINIHKSTISPKGILFLATNNGVIYLDTRSFEVSSSNPQLVMTSFYANDKTISTLPAHKLDRLRLSHDQNNLRIGLSILNDIEPKTREYAYRVNAQDWVSIGNQEFIMLSGLAPGEYSLEVNASTGEGISTEQPLQVELHILPPWYNSSWSWIAYFFILFLLGYVFYRVRINSILSQKEALKIKELDQFKNQFFTNIAHEFRTPLTVISGMAEKINRDPKMWSTRGAGLIRRNSQTLLRLINQILDLSKLGTGLHPKAII